MSTNTTVATIPTGWTQITWPYALNVTSTNVSGSVSSIDYTHAARSVLSAWTSTNKGQIDDIIGAAKYTTTAVGVSTSYWIPGHSVQFALAGTQASGTQVASWISYSSWSNFNVQTLTTVGTINNNVVTYSTGGDLFALNGTTAANVKGTTALTNTSSIYMSAGTTTSTSNGWFDILTSSGGNLVGPLTQGGSFGIKVGDSISYTAGYKVFATSTATTPTASAVGSGKWTLVDGATALSLSAGVAAAVAMIAF